MADGVLPARFTLLVKGEILSHVLVDLTERQLLVAGVLDGHGDERRVGVRRANHFEKLLLAWQGQPAQLGCPKPSGGRQELALARPVPVSRSMAPCATPIT